MSKNDGTSIKKEFFTWTLVMDKAFIELMIKEQNKGNRPEGTFTSQAYANMVEELSSYKPDIKKENLQNRLKTLKGNFAQYYDIFRGTSLSDFSLNPVTKLMDAEEEVWEALIKVKFAFAF